MSSAAFGSNPAACTLGEGGSLGPDRIVKNFYDAANQLLQVREGVGTLIEAAEATYSYTANGKRRFVIDGRGNRAELRYDGHDRQVRWIFPSGTPPPNYVDSDPTVLTSAGAVNEQDFEAYEYDKASNRTKLWKRDGLLLTYDYDALNRMRVKIVPPREATLVIPALSPAQTRDVYYSYDLRGLQRTARFDGFDGEGITNTYDGFGRLSSSLTSMDGSALTNNYLHDPDGNPAQLSTSAGYLLNFISDGLGRLIRIEEGGQNIVAQFGYDAAGRRSSLAMGKGGSFSSSAGYGYDTAGRLAGLGTDLAGTASDRTLGFGYNPASQMIAQTSDNASYAWTGAVNVNRNYTTNGLNQYGGTNSNGTPTATFSYDPNGNLISDGSTAYVYDVENRLVPGYARIVDEAHPRRRGTEGRGAVSDVGSLEGGVGNNLGAGGYAQQRQGGKRHEKRQREAGQPALQRSRRPREARPPLQSTTHGCESSAERRGKCVSHESPLRSRWLPPTPRLDQLRIVPTDRQGDCRNKLAVPPRTTAAKMEFGRSAGLSCRRHGAILLCGNALGTGLSREQNGVRT